MRFDSGRSGRCKIDEGRLSMLLQVEILNRENARVYGECDPLETEHVASKPVRSAASRRRKRFTENTGFTLIELLVVIAIIAILPYQQRPGCAENCVRSRLDAPFCSVRTTFALHEVRYNDQSGGSNFSDVEAPQSKLP